MLLPLLDEVPSVATGVDTDAGAGVFVSSTLVGATWVLENAGVSAATILGVATGVGGALAVKSVLLWAPVGWALLIAKCAGTCQL